MKRFLLFLSLCLFFLPFTQAQKVGLVLSGGGAKGMTHIGIIRALEENIGKYERTFGTIRLFDEQPIPPMTNVKGEA